MNLLTNDTLPIFIGATGGTIVGNFIANAAWKFFEHRSQQISWKEWCAQDDRRRAQVYPALERRRKLREAQREEATSLKDPDQKTSRDLDPAIEQKVIEDIGDANQGRFVCQICGVYRKTAERIYSHLRDIHCVETSAPRKE